MLSSRDVLFGMMGKEEGAAEPRPPMSHACAHHVRKEEKRQWHVPVRGSPVARQIARCGSRGMRPTGCRESGGLVALMPLPFLCRVLLACPSSMAALDVMLKNPGVLQCGPALDTLGPDEIKGFANIRNFGNKIPESARTAVIRWVAACPVVSNVAL